MTYTRINIEGLPGRYAVATRRADAAAIDVEVLLPDARRMHHVHADSSDDIRSMADCLPTQLAGDAARWAEYLELLHLLKEGRA